MGSPLDAKMTAGNMEAPDKLVCLKWVKEARKSVTTDVIVKSCACGIIVKIYGSEDKKIQYLRAEEATQVVANLITGATLNILEVAGEAESDDDHPFADWDSEHDEKLDN